ncbi:hypothetical protein [Streptomyces sp. CB01635]|nr:hypothetical protein [Streptomyces sp. CB01635]
MDQALRFLHAHQEPYTAMAGAARGLATDAVVISAGVPHFTAAP